MGMTPQAFDEVHSVSDLHLGGEPGRQIFGCTAELAGLIDHLRAQPAGRRLALVLNGDVVDFLAEPDGTAFDPDGAVRKLARIQADAAFKPVFDALRRFVATPDRILVVVLGNHDLELALPDVREALIASLCAGDAAARGRVQLCLDGAGFAARVGNANLLCVHGNDVDRWNATDYEHLRRLARDRQFGKPVPAWTPNAGSQMVIEVMNGIKRDLPFVDLLKPETEAVVPMLVALDQGSAARLRGVAGVAARLAWDSTRARFGFLSAEDEDEDEDGGRRDPLDEIVRGGMRGRAVVEPISAAELLRTAEAQLRDGVDPLALVAQDAQRDLGLGSALWDWMRGRSKAEVLREAIEQVQQDRSFDPDDPDGTFTSLDALIAPDVDIIIAGHTHLERAHPRGNRRGHYFNTGTWARLIQLTPAQLADERSFTPVFDKLRTSTSMAALDASGLVMRRPAVASVWREGGSTRGELRRVISDGAGVRFQSIGKGYPCPA